MTPAFSTFFQCEGGLSESCYLALKPGDFPAIHYVVAQVVGELHAAASVMEIVVILLVRL